MGHREPARLQAGRDLCPSFAHPCPNNWHSPTEPHRAGDPDSLADAEGTVPRTLEAWVQAQQACPEFQALLDTMDMTAVRHELWIHAPPDSSPIISSSSPRSTTNSSRATFTSACFTSAQPRFAMMKRSYCWPTMKRDVTNMLEDCPACELNKARQNTAHGLFSAMPVYAPRARWCMDFQGQGQSLTGETEALALIDPTSRYVVVIPLRDREAATWFQPFLDRIVFAFGAPDVLHSDAAPEFLQPHWTSWRKPPASAPQLQWATTLVAMAPSRSFGASETDPCAFSRMTTTHAGRP